MKKNLILILLGIVSITFMSCQRGNDQTGGGGGGAPRIALVMKTANNPFFIEMQKGAEDAAKRLGVNLVVQAAEREVDVEKQMQIVENLIQPKSRRYALRRAVRGRSSLPLRRLTARAFPCWS